MSAAEGDLTEGVDWLQRWRDAGYGFDWDDLPQVQLGPFGSVDSLGRKIPRRLGIHDYLLTVARSEPARVRRVPAAAVSEEGIDDEEGPYALVTCPCGARPVVRAALAKCTGCDRNYVCIDGGVFVAYGNMLAPPLVN